MCLVFFGPPSSRTKKTQLEKCMPWDRWHLSHGMHFSNCVFPSPPYSLLPNLSRLQTTYPASCVKCTCWNLWGYFGPGYARVRTRPSCDGKSTAASRIATIDCHIDGVCIHWTRHIVDSPMTWPVSLASLEVPRHGSSGALLPLGLFLLVQTDFWHLGAGFGTSELEKAWGVHDKGVLPVRYLGISTGWLDENWKWWSEYEAWHYDTHFVGMRNWKDLLAKIEMS